MEQSAKIELEHVYEKKPGFCAQGVVAILVRGVAPERKIRQGRLARKYAKRFEDWGTTNQELVKTLRKFFLDVEYRTGVDMKEVAEEMKRGHGVILDIWDDSEDGTGNPPDGHSVVVKKVDLENDKITIIDPSRTRKAFTHNGEKYTVHKEATIPIDLITSRWYDFGLKGERINHGAIFVGLDSYRK